MMMMSAMMVHKYDTTRMMLETEQNRTLRKAHFRASKSTDGRGRYQPDLGLHVPFVI